MRDILVAIASAAGGALLLCAARAVRRALTRRIHVETPEAAAIKQLVPAVNALLDMQGPNNEALIALLEATQGQCNGNVDRALEVTRKAQSEFQDFLKRSARVEAMEGHS